MKNIIIPLVIVLISGCGTPELITLPSLSAQLPRVISVVPKDGSTVKPLVFIKATFTKPIDPETANKDSILLVENYEDKPAVVIADQIHDGKLFGMEGAYKVSEDGFSVIFRPLNELIDGGNYAVIITDRLFTKDRFSLASLYISRFKVDSIEGENILIEQDDIDDNSTDTLDPSGEEGAGETTAESGTVIPVPEVPIKVVINEVLYDSSGSDTVGDLFVELKGSPGGNIAGYKVVFVNGEDGKITGSVSIPGGAKIKDNGLYLIADDIQGNAGRTLVAGADLISNFDPHNGPDAVQLLNAKGELVDAVCYGNVPVNIAENKLAMCEGSPAPDAPSGKSISRAADAVDSNDNSVDFFVNDPPTPGS